MTKLYHLNGGTLQREGGPKIICHCLLLEENGKLALIDTGIGMQDVLHPNERIGADRIEQFGFRFNMHDTAFRQIELLGLDPRDVHHCVLTHLDTDHTGGLADFPNALVHVSETELKSFKSGHPRYTPMQLSHDPEIKTYDSFTIDWFECKATPLDLGYSSEALLVWLPGHTHGHCGVAILQEDKWLLMAGDAYYMRGELFDDTHPATPVSIATAMDEQLWRQSFQSLRRIVAEHPDKVTVFSYHDPAEL